MEMWQDIVMMIAGFTFAPVLIVSIQKRVRYPLATSLPTAIAMTALTVCVASLGLYLTTVADALTMICWWILVKERN
jgi:hypothetical protein